MIEQDETDFGGFFDHIDDLLDFPTDDVDVGAASLPAATMTCRSFPSIWPALSDLVLSGNSSPELSMPYEDIVQLEWLPNFVEDDPSCGSLTLEKVDPSCTTQELVEVAQKQNQFQTFSPVSVLERGGSSSSCSGEKNAPCSPEIYIPVPSCVRGARSKRPRPATFNPGPAMQYLISPAASSVGENTMILPNAISKTSSDSENFAESRPLIKKKKKVRSSHHPLGSPDVNQNNVASHAVRKCMHCEITKTPQWRAGPFGPKSLCNACGVRYKSGRLFPEYRPAASPTFCPSLHSNSHQKVLKMRSKGGEITAASMEVHSADASPEVLIPNTDGSLTLEYM